MYNDAELLLQAAAEGLGVAVGTSPFANPLLESGRLIDPFNHQFSTGDGIVLTFGRGSQHNPSVITFTDWAAEIIPAVYEGMTS
jgi:LysR family glycine cleavage system transcriptional activator